MILSGPGALLFGRLLIIWGICQGEMYIRIPGFVFWGSLLCFIRRSSGEVVLYACSCVAAKVTAITSAFSWSP